MTSQIQVRVDAQQKKNAQKILKDLGLDLSTAIRMFIVQIDKTKGLPIDVRDEAGFRPHKAVEMRQASREAREGKAYTSVKELMKDLMS